jgi:hypothetical protein
MHRLEALQILKAKLGSVEETRHAELSENEDLRESIDAKAEAQALAAVFDFLKSCKIAPSNSLLGPFPFAVPHIKFATLHADGTGRVSGLGLNECALPI